MLFELSGIGTCLVNLVHLCVAAQHHEHAERGCCEQRECPAWVHLCIPPSERGIAPYIGRNHYQ
ncbi:uncharacterized protein STAUR_4399 [Stigmatella aurantiaca DW4/3-1]|uniref:Uncharacterized protein n=1 Tax=Stigmatella aurantiaca (strain DW4/3-1) TaxID=378806 RepID=E3FU39_STIAD|nr:uncharacterized protein STAUR_4399 [Stigmatella aurantiaca DW4/3-1]